MVPAHVVIGSAFVLGSLSLGGATSALLAVPALALTPLSSVVALVRHDLWGSRALLSRGLVRAGHRPAHLRRAPSCSARRSPRSSTSAPAGALLAATRRRAPPPASSPSRRCASATWRSSLRARSYKPTIEQLSEELTLITVPEEVGRAVERTVRRWLPCEHVEFRPVADRDDLGAHAPGDEPEHAERIRWLRLVSQRPRPRRARPRPPAPGAPATSCASTCSSAGARSRCSRWAGSGAARSSRARTSTCSAPSPTRRRWRWRTPTATPSSSCAGGSRPRPGVASARRWSRRSPPRSPTRSATPSTTSAPSSGAGRATSTSTPRTSTSAATRSSGWSGWSRACAASSTHRLERQRVAVDDLVRQGRAPAPRPARRPRARGRRPRGPRRAALRCDPDQVTQVLVNLISNALDAAGDAGRVGVTWVASTATARRGLTVWDSGPGLRGRPLARVRALVHDQAARHGPRARHHPPHRPRPRLDHRARARAAAGRSSSSRSPPRTSPAGRGGESERGMEVA